MGSSVSNPDGLKAWLDGLPDEERVGLMFSAVVFSGIMFFFLLCLACKAYESGHCTAEPHLDVENAHPTLTVLNSERPPKYCLGYLSLPTWLNKFDKKQECQGNRAPDSNYVITSCVIVPDIDRSAPLKLPLLESEVLQL